MQLDRVELGALERAARGRRGGSVQHRDRLAASGPGRPHIQAAARGLHERNSAGGGNDAHPDEFS